MTAAMAARPPRALHLTETRVARGERDADAVRLRSLLCDGEPDGAEEPEGRGETLREGAPVVEAVADALRLGGAEALPLRLGAWEALAEALRERVAVPLGEALAEGDAVAVAHPDAVLAGEGLGEGEAQLVAVAAGDGVGAPLHEGERVPVEVPDAHGHDLIRWGAARRHESDPGPTTPPEPETADAPPGETAEPPPGETADAPAGQTPEARGRRRPR